MAAPVVSCEIGSEEASENVDREAHVDAESLRQNSSAETDDGEFKKPSLLSVGSSRGTRPHLTGTEAEGSGTRPVAPESGDDNNEGKGGKTPTPPPPLPYREPSWSSVPNKQYSLEIIKEGAIIGYKKLEGHSLKIVGRLACCDIQMDHPSVSRYHAVLQFGQIDEQGSGWAVYDLQSTHGTFVNKERLPGRSYRRLRVGHTLRVGASSRMLVLQGPETDEEVECELSVTELKALGRKRKEKLESLEQKMLGEDQNEEEEGPVNIAKSSQDENATCNWGMDDYNPDEDGEEEEQCDENPFAVGFHEEKEAYYVKDPKKALREFFEREGMDLEYDVEEKGPASWLCKVRLQMENSNGHELVAEAAGTGRKKEVVVQCALEACRMLDANGLLRQEAGGRKRKERNWEEADFYDSDEDTFLDRTGAVEHKRLQRMRKAGKVHEKTDTYDSLIQKLKDVDEELCSTEEQLKLSKKAPSTAGSDDSLEAYMSEIRSGTVAVADGVARRKLRLRSFELKKERQRLARLVEIARPASLPDMKPLPGQHPSSAVASRTDGATKKLFLPMFGAMKGGCKLKTGTVGRLPQKREPLPSSLFSLKTKEVEEDDDDDEEEEIQRKHDIESSSISGCTELKSSTNDPVETPDVQSAPSFVAAPPAECCERDFPVDSTGDAKGVCQQEIPVVKEDDSRDEAQPKMQRKQKIYGPRKPPQLHPHVCSRQDPKYASWLPPEDQTGDGKTYLNEKFGY
uniref:kanadaptin n=1 Tax=Myxine glutinosa TaxID=7769 RepID=UPI00358E3F2F